MVPRSNNLRPLRHRVKLVYLINGLGAGGAERSLAELLPFYGRAGIETTVVCLTATAIGVESDVRVSGCDLVFLPGRRLPQWTHSFRALIRAHRPDLIHTTLADANLVGRVGSAGTGIPVLTSLVNTPYVAARAKDKRLRPWKVRIVREVDGWTARNLTTHFHALTHAVRDAYVETLRIPRDRITVIARGRDTVRLGVQTPERRRSVRHTLGLEDRHEVLINVARQEYQKGQRFLLEAFARLAASRPNLILLVAGRDGHQTPELRELHSRLGLGNRVRFLGHRTDIPDLLTASDIFVFPSLLEGLGGAVIEAMALGLPVIASDIPVLREVVEEGRTAELVEPESSIALAAAIESLLDDPGRRTAYGARAREVFAARFGIAQSAERMVEMYRAVASRTSGSVVQRSALSSPPGNASVRPAEQRVSSPRP